MANTATKSTTRTAKQAAKKASGGAKKAARTASSTAKSTARKATGTSRAKKSGARRSSRSSQDAIAFLKSEHREVEDLFKKFEKLGDGAHKSREATVGKIIEALSKHAAIEEEILYPEIRERVEKGGDDDDMVLEALEEHHVAKATLAEIERLPSEDERFKAKVTVLMESVRHHVDEEEDELFPKVRDMFSKSELDEMGARLKAARQTAPSRPHPMAPDEPPGNIIANTLTAPLDATVAVAGGAARAVRRAVR